MSRLGAVLRRALAWSSGKRESWLFALIALFIRASIVRWALPRISPVADGAFYQTVAERISQGLGYTWLWPDGVVTYAAHYPVGYPAMVGALYALFGAKQAVAMSFNALLGALSVFALHRIALACASRKSAAVAALLLALYPGLAAYTPALMTEGVTASLLTCGAWASMHAGKSWAGTNIDWRAEPRKSIWTALKTFFPAGLIFGAATLVRPQSVLLAPLFIWVSAGGIRNPKRAAAGAAFTLAMALMVCTPWTARNCVRIKSCALVSVNGGWNLLIGADKESNGSWAPIKVPDACREVWDEAAKDACFGREAKRYILEHPGAWLSLIPSKLGATFNYRGAAGWYLHASNPQAFPEKAKIALGAAEVVYERLLLIAALIAAARLRIACGPLTSWRVIVPIALAGLGILSAFIVQAWLGFALLALLSLWPAPRPTEDPFIVRALGVVLFATIAVHAVFFGAGRYSLVVIPLLCGVAALAAQKRPITPAPTAHPPQKS